MPKSATILSETDYVNMWVGKIVHVHIDRPIGSQHPQFSNIIYPINYGFIPGTKAPDGDEIDAYIIGIHEPVKSFTGKCIAIICRSDDVEYKLVVTAKDQDVTKDQIAKETYFQEQYFNSKILK